jgi:tRNA threonylcarbamoyl adenosine modification protein YeaZ
LTTVLLLAVDTATPAVTAGVVELTPGSPPGTPRDTRTRSAEAPGQSLARPGLRLLAQRVTFNAKAHGELLTPHVQDALAEAGVSLADIDAIVCGSGPGPFTGLRVGMVTAAALGQALNRPVYPVPTPDAIALDAATGAPLLVATDARRREVYWAAYDAACRRTAGPHVQRPAELAEKLPSLGVAQAAGEGARIYADVLGLPLVDTVHPSPVGLVAAAADEVLANAEPAPLTPLYLRRPDAVEPVGRKRVTRG